MPKFILLLQAYNQRHESEYHGFTTVKFYDNGSGTVLYQDEIILFFDNIKQLEDYLENN